MGTPHGMFLPRAHTSMNDFKISHYLGLLQDDPDDRDAMDHIARAATSPIEGDVREETLRLVQAALEGHKLRREMRTYVSLIEATQPWMTSDPTAALQRWIDVAKTRHEWLLDDEGALQALARARELEASTSETPEVAHLVREMEAARASYKSNIASLLKEADAAKDKSLKSSLLAEAASLTWQYQTRSKDKETDKLFRQALAVDGSNLRAAMRYEHVLVQRAEWGAAAELMLSTAEAIRNREDRLSLYLRAARLFARVLQIPDRAAACYERVLDAFPAHSEALRYLVQYVTEKENWDAVISLYEGALRARQKPDSEKGTLLQIAMVHWKIRQSLHEAEPYFARLRKIDPTHPGMLDFYRELLTGSKDESKLLAILSDAQRASSDPEQKLRLASELGQLADRHPTATERAIDAWKTVQKHDPDNAQAREALRVLLRRAEKWNALIELIRADVERVAPDDVHGKVALLREMVPIYRDHLGLDTMVVQTYNAILQIVPDDPEALESLAQTYEAMGRWHDLIQVLTKQAEITTDTQEAIRRYVRLAALWIECFANYNQATRPLERVVELDPDNLEALLQLRDIYTKQRSWKPLCEVLRKQINLSSDPSARLDIMIDLAKVLGEKIHNYSESIQVWREVLGADPSREGVLEAIEKLAERAKDWDALAESLEQSVHQQTSSEGRIRLLQKLGALYADQLQDTERAIAAWDRVLKIEPKHGRALRTLRDIYLGASDWDNLHNLYAASDDWEGLVDVMSRAADRATDADTKVALSFRVARIFEDQLGEPQRAFRSYERVLSVDPYNVDAARSLIPIYEKEERWSRLLSLFEVLFAARSPSDPVQESVALLERMRDLALEKLNDVEAAFRYASQAYTKAPESDDAREKLEAIAARANRYQDLKQLYLQRLGNASRNESMDLRWRIVSLSLEKLQTPENAITHLEALLTDAPTNMQAYEQLRALYVLHAHHESLKRLYLNWIAQHDDPSERLVTLRDLATLEEETLGDFAAARDHLRAILQIDPADLDALQRLDRIHLRGEDWPDLRDVLERKRELSTDEHDYVELTRRLAALYHGVLENHDAALRCTLEILDRCPADPDAVAQLERLMESHPDAGMDGWRALGRAYELKNMPGERARVLCQQLQRCGDGSEALELRLQLADLYLESLHDDDRGFQVLCEVLETTPQDQSLWARLQGAAERAQRVDALIVVFARVFDSNVLADDDKLELAVRIANLYDRAVGMPAEAERFHRWILEHDPVHEHSFRALKDLYTNSERWDDLQKIYRNRIAQSFDAREKIDLSLQLCFLLEEILDDADLAIKAYQDVLELDPDHVAARRSLERLFAKTQRWRDLAELLTVEQTRAQGQDAIELSYRLGELYELQLSQPDRAIDCYEQVLTEQPTHLRAQEALERMLREPSERRQRIASILEPLYQDQGAYHELTHILEVQLENVETTAADRVALWTRIADLREHKLDALPGAFQAMAAAAESDPTDVMLRQELARLARLQGAETQRAAVLERLLEKTSGELDVQGEILKELAALWESQPGAMQHAERAYARLLDLDTSNTDLTLLAARALERIHITQNNYDALSRDLRVQVQSEFDPEQKKALLNRLGLLFERALARPLDAVSVYHEILELDPADVSAVHALERIHEQQGSWHDLIGVLRVHDRIAETEAEQAGIAIRIAEIYQRQLGDIDNAIAAFNDVVVRFGPTPAALAALRSIYVAQKRWEELLEVLQMQRELASDEETRFGIQIEMADIMSQHTGQFASALDLYREVLELRAHRASAIAGAERLLGVSDLEVSLGAARLLAPVYEETTQADKQLLAYEVLCRSADVEEQMYALQHAATVAEQGLGDIETAYRKQEQLVRLARGDDRLSSILTDWYRLTSMRDDWQRYVHVLLDIVPDIVREELLIAVVSRIAKTAYSRLNDRALAEEYYSKLLELRPDDIETLDALEQLRESSGDFLGLLDILKRRSALAPSPEARHWLWLRQAEVAETQLGDAATAIEAYESLMYESDRQDAYDGLARLYTKTERWNDLASLYERQIEKRLGSVAEAHHKLGVLYLRSLNDSFVAFDHFRQALELAPGHPPTVQVLESLMVEQGHRSEAARLLEPAYLAAMDWGKLLDALSARFEATEDVDERKRILIRMGELQEDQLEDLDGAMETYARLFREDIYDEKVWETLGRLARVLEKWARLDEVYTAALDESGVVDAATARLAFTLGRVLEQRLQSPQRAITWFERAYQFDPTEHEYAGALEAAYVRAERWTELVQLYRSLAEVAASDSSRVDFLFRAARVLQDKLLAVHDSVEVYRQILDHDPTSVRALEQLDALLTTEERWDELKEVLYRELELAEGSLRVSDLKYRCAELLAFKLGDVDQALDILEEILSTQPNHQGALRALETLVQNDAVQLRVIEILEPVYRNSDQWKKRIAVYEAKCALVQDPSEKIQLLAEIANLHEHRGRDESLALDAWGRALLLDPSNQPIQEEVERLGRRLGNWDEQIATYEGAVQAADDVDAKMVLLGRIAAIHEQQRDDAKAAIDTYERMLKLDESDARALGAVEALATSTKDWAKLADVLQRRVATTYEGQARKALLSRLGKVYDELLRDPASAIDAYRQVLDEDPLDEVALNELDVLYTATRDAAALWEILQKKTESQVTVMQRVNTLLRMGELAEAQLDRSEDAMDVYERVLLEQRHHPTALSALERLYRKHERWTDLLGTLKIQGELVESPDAKAGYLFQQAEILADRLDDVPEAVRMLNDCVQQVPGHPAAVQFLLDATSDPARREVVLDTAAQDDSVCRLLCALYESEARWKDHADLLAKKVEFSTDSQERNALRLQMAQLYATRLADLQAAVVLYQTMLDEDPGSLEVTGLLEALFEQLERWTDLEQLLLRRIDMSTQVTERVALRARLAYLYEMRLGNKPEAIVVWRDVFEESPMHPSAYVELERLLKVEGRWDELSEVMQRRVDTLLQRDTEQDRTEALALKVSLADICLAKLDHPDQAMMWLQRVLEQKPDEKNVAVRLESLYTQHEELAKLVGLLQAQSTVWPEDKDLALRLADLYEKTDASAEEKIAVLERVLALHANKRAKELAPVYHRLGRAYQAQGNVTAALESYESAFRIDLKNPEILRDMGLLYYMQSDYEQSQRVFRSLLLQDLGHVQDLSKADVYYYLGDIAMRQGEVSKAVNMLQRALSEDPHHERAEQLLTTLNASHESAST
jgi:tetratricopeptide (TPR) repeat protein